MSQIKNNPNKAANKRQRPHSSSVHAHRSKPLSNDTNKTIDDRYRSRQVASQQQMPIDDQDSQPSFLAARGHRQSKVKRMNMLSNRIAMITSSSNSRPSTAQPHSKNSKQSKDVTNSTPSTVYGSYLDAIHSQQHEFSTPRSTTRSRQATARLEAERQRRMRFPAKNYSPSIIKTLNSNDELLEHNQRIANFKNEENCASIAKLTETSNSKFRARLQVIQQVNRPEKDTWIAANTSEIHERSRAKLNQLESMLNEIKRNAKTEREEMIFDALNETGLANINISNSSNTMNNVNNGNNGSNGNNGNNRRNSNRSSNHRKSQNLAESLATEHMKRLKERGINITQLSESNKFLIDVIHDPTKKRVSKEDELVAYDALMNQYHNLAQSPSVHELSPIRIDRLVNLRVKQMVSWYRDGSADRAGLQRQVDSVQAERRAEYQIQRKKALDEFKTKQAEWEANRERARARVQANKEKIENERRFTLSTALKSLHDKAKRAKNHRKRVRTPFKSQQLWLILLKGYIPALQSLLSVYQRKDELIIYRQTINGSAIKLQRWWHNIMSCINSIDLKTLENMKQRKYVANNQLIQQMIRIRIRQLTEASNQITSLINTVSNPSFRFQVLMLKNDHYRINAIKIQNWWRKITIPQIKLKQQLNKRWIKIEEQLCETETSQGRYFRKLPTNERNKIISDIVFKHFRTQRQKTQECKSSLLGLYQKQKIIQQYSKFFRDLGIQKNIFDSKKALQNDENIPDEMKDLLNNEFQMHHSQLRTLIRRSSQDYNMNEMSKMLEQTEKL